MAHISGSSSSIFVRTSFGLARYSAASSMGSGVLAIKRRLRASRPRKFSRPCRRFEIEGYAFFAGVEKLVIGAMLQILPLAQEMALAGAARRLRATRRESLRGLLRQQSANA